MAHACLVFFFFILQSPPLIDFEPETGEIYHENEQASERGKTGLGNEMSTYSLQRDLPAQRS